MARDFDGSDDIISIGNVLDFERTAPFSFLLWAKRDAINAFHVMICKFNASTRGYYFAWSSANELDLELISTWDTSVIKVLSSTTYSDTDWHHAAVTYSGSSLASGVKLYRDGSLLSNTVSYDNLTTSISNTGNLRISSRSDNNSQYFNGLMAEVAIYNIELTITEVVMCMRGHYPRIANRVGYWPIFGNQSPEPDWSGSNNHGTVTGAVRADHPPGISAYWLGPQVRRVQRIFAAGGVSILPQMLQHHGG